MKKIILLLVGALLCCMSLFAETVSVTTAGTLNESFGEGEGKLALTITDLTITGEINARDFDFIRTNLTALETLDISGASIVYYQGAVTASPNSNDEYPANELPKDAFSGHTILQTVTLPSSLTAIGENAFFNCTALTSADIPWDVENFTKIGKQAYYKTAITSFDIPATVDTIHQATFQDCAQLESVWFYEGLKVIGASAFSGCTAFTDIYLPVGLDSIAGSAFSGITGLTSIEFPEGLRSIAASAFSYTGLTEAKFPEGFKRLYATPFSHGSSTAVMATIVLPSTMEYIDVAAFHRNASRAVLPNLTKIYSYMENPIDIDAKTFTISASATVKNATLYVPFGATANYNKTGWNTFAIGNAYGNQIVEMKDPNATEATISLSEAGTLNGEFGTGGYPVSITKLTVTGQINVLDFDFIRTNLTALDTLDISGASIVYYKGATATKLSEDNEYPADELPEGALKSSKWNLLALKTVNLPTSLTSIGNDAFNGSTNITSADIPSGVTKIGSAAYYKTAVTSISIPAGVDTIRNNTFQDCAQLTSVTFSDAGNLKLIGGSAFSSAGLTSLTLPEGLDSIAGAAFYYNPELIQVNFPTTLRGIGSSAFFYNTGLTNVVLPEGLEYLASSVFSFCENLESQTLPSTLKGINDGFMNSGMPFEKLTAIYSYMENPVVITAETFNDVDKTTCKLYVPYGKKGNYTNKTGWRDFGSNIVEMKTAVTAVSLDKTTLSLQVNETGQLTATIEPADANNQALIWSSSNESVATVDANGLVTATAVGEAVISATSADDENIKAACTVTVTPAIIAVTGITLNKSTLELSTGASETLTAIIAPADATNKNVVWSSSNESVATVDANGLVTAIAVGETVITVTTEDGGYTASCTVTVEQGSGLWNAKNNIDFVLQGNPVSNEARFSFESAGNGASIVIVDLTGKTVATESIANGATEAVVNVSGLSKGVYLARYADAKGKQGSLKLVK